MLLELLQCQEYKIMVQITSIWKKKSLGVMSGLFLVEVRLAAHVSKYDGHAVSLWWKSTRGVVADELQSDSQGLYREV